MPLLAAVLAVLVVAIQYPLWLGNGGKLRVRDAERQLQAQQKTNAILEARNAKLAAEVTDLREGAGAVEERARYELGMIKEGEVFVQVIDSRPNSAPSNAPGTGMEAVPVRRGK